MIKIEYGPMVVESVIFPSFDQNMSFLAQCRPLCVRFLSFDIKHSGGSMLYVCVGIAYLRRIYILTEDPLRGFAHRADHYEYNVL